MFMFTVDFFSIETLKDMITNDIHDQVNESKKKVRYSI